MSNLISTLKKNDSISYDLIQNTEGEEHYKDDFISIDVDNIEQEANTGFYDGVEINIYSGDDIKEFDKLSADKTSWDFIIPIVKVHMQGITAKQFENFISSIGSNLKELSLDFSDFQKLNTSIIAKSAPKLKKLSLKGDSWDEEMPIVLTLDDINLLDLDFLKIDVTGKKKVFDLSKTNITELELDDFDASKSKLPNSLKKLVARVNCEEINWSNLTNLISLELSFCSDATVSDLTFLSKLGSLKDLNLQLAGEVTKFTFAFPALLENLDINTYGLEIDLQFLSSCKSLKSLKLRTDVGNGGKGFKNLDALSDLQMIETLELEENAMGTNNYKSGFKTKSLSETTSLKNLVLDGMINVKDLTDFKGMNNLEYLKIRNSRIESLKGAEALNALKKLELFDCHSIDDLTFLANPSLEKFSFSISLFWATEVKLKKEHIQQLDKVAINEIEIYIEDRKFPKKDYTNLTKKYDLEPDGCSLWLTLKK